MTVREVKITVTESMLRAIRAAMLTPSQCVFRTPSLTAWTVRCDVHARMKALRLIDRETWKLTEVGKFAALASPGDSILRIRMRQAGIQHLPSSVNGNPRFRIRCLILGGTPDYVDLITMSDINDAYAIENGWKDKVIRTAHVILSPANRIRYFRYLDNDTPN